MRVNNPNIGNAQASELGSARKADRAKTETKETEKQTPAVDTSGSANVEVSAKAREMAQANDIANSAPDLRESKIAELKRRIAAKQYNVKPEDIADKMVDEHIKTRQIS